MEKLVLGPPVYSDLLGVETPSTITTPEGLSFDWDEDRGFYPCHGDDKFWLYLEDVPITPETWYEITPT